MARFSSSVGTQQVVGLALIAVVGAAAAAPAGTERTAGLREAPSRWHAITEARLVIKPGVVVERGTLVMRDGVIVAAGADVKPPAGARVWAMPGRTVYAGFIDASSSLGVPEALRERVPLRPADPFSNPFEDRATPGARPPAPPSLVARSSSARNPMLRAEQQVAAQWQATPEQVAATRRLGFTAVLAAPSWGIWRGQGALVALRSAPDAKGVLIDAAPTQHLGLDVNSFTEPRMPTSLMGALAVARQAVMDARWQLRTPGAEPNATLSALAPVLNNQQLLMAQARDEQDLLRLVALRDEMQLPSMVIQGNGFEYRRAAQQGAAQVGGGLALAFPEAPEAAGDAAFNLPLHQLQHWEQAPSNAAWLRQAGVPIAFTAAGLRNPEREFWPRIRQAVRRGLSADDALAALTTTPAQWLRQGKQLGSLESGRLAHVVVMQGDPFRDADAELELSFVGNQTHPGPAWQKEDPRGSWAVQGVEPTQAAIAVTGSRMRPVVKDCQFNQDGRQWALQCGSTRTVAEQSGDTLQGTQQAGDGPVQPWRATRTARSEREPPKPVDDPSPAPTEARYPFGAYGQALPPQGSFLLRNATVWTQGTAGTLQAADVLVREGRIAAVGAKLAPPPEAQIVDATGLHLTPGLIDAHSHIAISRGINEFSDAITAEVRVGDVLDATDINIYRQLAGGVTSANLLHGSANVIGGQSAVIKLRWGQDARGLAFVGAAPSIKFALGENVKQSNFGGGDRYPQTRMGVEQTLIDAFAQAQSYAAESPSTRRRDQRLDTLAEILAGTRQIHIHSYRADEILMFTRLAKDLKLKVAAFQHVLEGYKVADAIASINAGASTFADWWAFKAESFDAVVGNAAMLTRAGVVTSLNSDDAELGRRLNTEAAKAVKVGALSPEAALALVTINPAKQLGVAARTGSIEVGKDADLVLWNGPPLSAFSRVERTWVDGRAYFSRQQDAVLRLRDANERERLLQRLAKAPRPTPDRPDRPDRPEGGASADSPTDWRALVDRARALARAAHADYHNGQTTHECTEDHTQ